MVEQEDGARSALLLRLARHVTARHDLDDVLAEVFRCLRPIIAFGGGSIQLLDDEGWIVMAAADPAAPAYVLAARVPLGSSTAGRVILTEQPVYLPDIEARSAIDTNGNRVSSGVRSYLGVPLVADGRAIGLLQVDSPAVDAWTSEQRSMFLAVAPIVAAAIQNARAHGRAAAAQARASELDARMADARSAVLAARAAARSGDTAELEGQLARLEAVLEEPGDAPVLRLPRPKSGEQEQPVRNN